MTEDQMLFICFIGVLGGVFYFMKVLWKLSTLITKFTIKVIGELYIMEKNKENL